MSWDRDQLETARSENLVRMALAPELTESGLDLLRRSYEFDYAYQWSWAGFPIIQMPEDIVMVQEVIWRSRPTVVVECGVAWGGGMALCASIMSLYHSTGHVLGVDLNLDPSLEDRLAALHLPIAMKTRADSSTSDGTLEWVRAHISPQDRVMVILDSNHSHDHVLSELRAYSDVVTAGQFLLACDTIVKDIPSVTHRDREWGIQGNPHTAVESFLVEDPRYSRESRVNGRLLTSFHPGGYLIKAPKI